MNTITLKAISPAQVRIYNYRYTANSGRAPRGRGSWAFHPDFNVDAMSKDIFWTPGNTSYAEAKKLAKAHFASKGIFSVETLP